MQISHPLMQNVPELALPEAKAGEEDVVKVERNKEARVVVAIMMMIIMEKNYQQQQQRIVAVFTVGQLPRAPRVSKAIEVKAAVVVLLMATPIAHAVLLLPETTMQTMSKVFTVVPQQKVPKAARAAESEGNPSEK